MTRTDYVLSQIVCLMAVLGFDRSLKIPMFFMSRVVARQQGKRGKPVHGYGDA
jgi:hypothetical protein